MILFIVNMCWSFNKIIMNKSILKLDQLTSLRFFAAIMIVFHHSYGLFGFVNDGKINLGQGVSFFFVLSGFILTYVYPDLKGWTNIRHFLKARIARIWPIYITSFLFGYLILDYDINLKTIGTFLLMLQSWIPISAYYFSYNAVSWSISTELFFYLLFPFLIYSWNKTNIIKLGLSFSLVIILIFISNYFELPAYSQPGISGNNLGITEHGLIYISPLSRIFEFIFGMTIATLYRNNMNNRTTVFVATIYEISAILIVVISMFYTNFIINLTNNTIMSPGLGQWITHSGSMFAFGLLIYVIAKGNGKISKILSYPFFVILGEISFSLYLLHQILLTYYRINKDNFAYFSEHTIFIIFLLILISISYLAWGFIEMPIRKIVMGSKKIHFSIIMKEVSTNKLIDKNKVIAGSFLIFLMLLAFIPSNYQLFLNRLKFERSNEIIYSLLENDLIFNQDLQVLNQSIKNINLKSVGNDPIINFPLLNINANNEYIMNIKIRVSKNSILQIFYSDNIDNSFSEKNSIKYSLKEGDNNIFILLNYKNMGNQIRLDPVISSDIELMLDSIEIRLINDL